MEVDNLIKLHEEGCLSDKGRDKLIKELMKSDKLSNVGKITALTGDSK